MNKENLKKINRRYKKITDKRGLTILFAILVSILVLAVGASIINLALKQVVLSGSSRDSQFAFYASNTGVECALYWDIQGNPSSGVIFATSSASTLTTDGSVICGGDTLTGGGEGDLEIISSDSTSASTKFRIQFQDVPYCVDVVVTKEANGGRIDTTLDSYGYNTCDEENARRIERGLQVTY